MNELEHRYTGKKVKFFFHTNEEMATFCGVSVWTIKKAKRELSEYSFIKTSQMHWVERETKRKSERHVTAYRICDR
jgi:DNA-binding transcriptional regulator YhcF (GntR family)